MVDKANPRKVISAAGRSSVLDDNEKARRVSLTKSYIRTEATYTPTMLQLINQRIENNGFRRLISDNAIYQRIMNTLKDNNSPENERHPNIVDFLALEAMLPVNYNSTYNRVLSEWYQRCNVPEWAENQMLIENHICFEHEMATAKAFLHKQLVQSRAAGEAQPELAEKITDDLNSHYWRSHPEEHYLINTIMNKVKEHQKISEREVLTVLAIYGGGYTALLLKHLVYNQDGEHCDLGDVTLAIREIETDDDLYKDVENAEQTIAIHKLTVAHSITLDKRGDHPQAKKFRKEAGHLEKEAHNAENFLHRVLQGGLKKRDAFDKAIKLGRGKNRSRAAVAAAAAASVQLNAEESDGETVRPGRTRTLVDVKEEPECDIRAEMLHPSIEID
ncbi:hypothetical protein ACHAQH_005293 [Verticillium albo-atrum]